MGSCPGLCAMSSVDMFLLSCLLFCCFCTGSARRTLQSAKNCGIPTGGREECYFDCQIVPSAQGSGQLIKDLTCLRDCFSSEESADDSCISSLLNDVIKDGVCDLTDEYGYNPGPGIYKPVNEECVMGVVASSYGFDQTVIDVGTCSSVTEGLLSTEQCRREIMEEQGFIQNTLLQLVQNSCNHTVSEFYVNFMQGNLPVGRRKREAEEPQLNSRVKRLAPAQVIYGSDGISTELDFENTQNRYSWICSLQSTGSSAEHLCAVNILSVKRPTVIVGAAHCTFLCKAGARQVSPCCCSSGPGNCAAKTSECGEKPGVVEMSEGDASIVCGRWKYDESEDKEIVLNIMEIVRHPDYDNVTGPISGADLVVFKVDDKPLMKRTARTLNPACLPTNDKQPTSVIHAGWSKPPPLSYIKARASEYEQFYDDFFKQWHYKMDILNKCEDPKKESITGAALKFPSNSSYPAATLCATDFSKQSCFSQGESGSPLMVENEKGEFSIEGILSFVKGCDVFTFGTTDTTKNNAQLNQQTENPTTYTKLSCYLPWVAEQYGMDYEGSGQEDKACLVASGGNRAGRNEVCRNTPSNLVELFSGEVECIFPFYYKDKKYDGCILFEEDGFVYPVFRCPTRDIPTKIEDEEGTYNSFEFLPLVDGYCPADSTDPNSPLDPNITDCSPFARRSPFSQCKNNCPGVQALGIIGG